jgi:5-methylcytosine-specific restriction endonuclease McrA
MTTGTRDPFYSSPEWLTVRRQVLIRDQWRCTVCHRDVHKKGQARVDHIKDKRAHPELALHMPNLRTFCASCDNKRHAEKGHGHSNFGVARDGTPLDPGHPWNTSSAPPLPYAPPDDGPEH